VINPPVEVRESVQGSVHLPVPRQSAPLALVFIPVCV
jgi:hypothetical protein